MIQEAARRWLLANSSMIVAAPMGQKVITDSWNAHGELLLKCVALTSHIDKFLESTGILPSTTPLECLTHD